MVVCQCACGNLFTTSISNIRNGHRVSCGCKNTEIFKNNGKNVGKIPNKTIDYSKVENPYYIFNKQLNEKKDNCFLWDIICKKCNKHYKEVPTFIISDKRRRGNNPCKCWQNQSKGVLKIINILKEMNINFYQEYTFDSCKSPKGKFLKFDFYLPDYDILIEYDGEQHFQNNGLFGASNAEEKLILQKEYDNIKNNWCINNNKKLIRISYKDYNNLDKKYLEGVIYGRL